jgi:hypothetical protein
VVYDLRSASEVLIAAEGRDLRMQCMETGQNGECDASWSLMDKFLIVITHTAVNSLDTLF